MKDTEAISRCRSEVIERTINLEWIINAIISHHYFKYVNGPFLFEVLYDEYFSFALKRRVLEKIVPDLDKRQLQNLNRVNTIRNYFAHCNQTVIEASQPSVEKVPDPRKLDRAIDFEKLHSEFMTIMKPLEEYLVALYTELGGQWYDKPLVEDTLE